MTDTTKNLGSEINASEIFSSIFVGFSVAFSER